MHSFTKHNKLISIWHFLPLVLLAAVLIITWYSADSMRSSNTAREKVLLSQALARSVTQCYALEGTYPPDLSYVEEHYGLTYDHDRYFIDYQYIGANLRPDITIIERE